MTQEHPITPPPELIRKWNVDAVDAPIADKRYIATQAARWGADQQLEQCEKYWMTHGISPEGVVAMRYALRPKPPSLKEQALEELYAAERSRTVDYTIIRRALESLPD